jgi:hypothetical protein
MCEPGFTKFDARYDCRQPMLILFVMINANGRLIRPSPILRYCYVDVNLITRARTET